MKKKIFAVGLVVMLLVAGLILASCGLNCPGSRNVASGKCKYSLWQLTLKDCDNECIDDQLVGLAVLSDKSCNCY